MSGWLATASLSLSAIAAVLGVRAATIRVRNSQDDFIDDLQKQGRWAALAALCAAAATAVQVAYQLL
jgi:hypothetical protein